MKAHRWHNTINGRACTLPDGTRVDLWTKSWGVPEGISLNGGAMRPFNGADPFRHRCESERIVELVEMSNDVAELRYAMWGE